MKFVLIAVIALLVAFYFYKTSTNKQAAEENLSLGSTFLLENKDKQDVKVTSSGLQYIALEQGDGNISPSAMSRVKVHYHGTLIDGTVFDSSVERGQPISFGLNQVIKGWTEGLQLMKEGDKFRFFIPPELGYGNRSAGKIPPGSVLIFDVELLKVES